MNRSDIKAGAKIRQKHRGHETVIIATIERGDAPYHRCLVADVILFGMVAEVNEAELLAYWDLVLT